MPIKKTLPVAMRSFNNNVAVGVLAFSLPGLSLSSTIPEASPTLEEVVVTAQRRAENLQDVPIAVTAFTQSDLDDLGISGLDGISAAVPNLNLTTSLGYSTNAIINIRGNMQRGNNLSRDTSVGVYVDGVPISKTTGAIFDVIDLERVEVLRGPQGTLYGKNTIGGAINLITQKPSGAFGVDLEVGIGNEDLLELRTAVDTNTIGIPGEGIGQLSARASGFLRKRDGFYENSHPSTKDYDNRDQIGGRLALHLDVTDSLSIDYTYDQVKMDQRPTFLPLTNGLPASKNERPDSTPNDSSLKSDLTLSGHAIVLQYDLGNTPLGQMTVKSISSVREFDNEVASDFDGSGLDLIRFINDTEFKQKSQEFQLLGTTDSSNWVLGLFYYTSTWSTENPRWTFQLGGDAFDTDNRGSEETSYAAFGQFTWTPSAFEEKLDLTFGIRTTKEDKEVDRLRVSINRFSVPGTGPCDLNSGVYLRDGANCPLLDMQGNLQSVSTKESWSQTTPMFVASWHINDDSQIYAKAVTGFRSGGINAVAATEEAFKTPFDAETMTSYELGYKGRMINNRLQLNAAYFYNDFKDIQAEVFVPELLSQNVVNAGDAKIQGMEIEVLAKPTEQFELGLNLAWLEPEYKDFYEGGVDVSDDRVFPYSPELSGNAIIKYQYGNTPFGQLSAHINYSWKDDHYFGLQEDTSVDIESYSLLDARISLSNIPIGNESLRVSLWGKNLEDTEYWDSALNLVFITVAQWADPRSYGLEFSYQF